MLLIVRVEGGPGQAHSLGSLVVLNEPVDGRRRDPRRVGQAWVLELLILGQRFLNFIAAAIVDCGVIRARFPHGVGRRRHRRRRGELLRRRVGQDLVADAGVERGDERRRSPVRRRVDQERRAVVGDELPRRRRGQSGAATRRICHRLRSHAQVVGGGSAVRGVIECRRRRVGGRRGRRGRHQLRRRCRRRARRHRLLRLLLLLKLLMLLNRKVEPDVSSGGGRRRWRRWL